MTPVIVSTIYSE